MIFSIQPKFSNLIGYNITVVETLKINLVVYLMQWIVDNLSDHGREIRSMLIVVILIVVILIVVIVWSDCNSNVRAGFMPTGCDLININTVHTLNIENVHTIWVRVPL